MTNYYHASFIQHSFGNQLPHECSTPNSQSPNTLFSDVDVKVGKPKGKGSFKFPKMKGPEFGGKIDGPDVKVKGRKFKMQSFKFGGPDVDVNVKAPSISGSLSGSGPDIKVKAPKVKASKADEMCELNDDIGDEVETFTAVPQSEYIDSSNKGRLKTYPLNILLNLFVCGASVF